jgi:ketosteroid isomerase-like protein
MSRENVEAVRRFVDQFNATGELPWAAMGPDVVWVVDPGAFLAGTYRGHDGVRTLFERLAEVFGEVRVETGELIDAGDSVIAIGRFRVRGLASGATARSRSPRCFGSATG